MADELEKLRSHADACAVRRDNRTRGGICMLLGILSRKNLDGLAAKFHGRRWPGL